MENNTNTRDHRDIRRMQKYYFACLREVARAYNLNADDLHDVWKVGFKKKTTSNMSFDEMYEYLDLSLALIRIVFDMYFDSEGYKLDGISRVRLRGTEKPDNRKSLRKE